MSKIYLVGGLQEHHDQTYVDSCKNKGLQHQEVCSSNHTPSSFRIKEAWTLTWVRWFFRTLVYHLNLLAF